MHVLVTGGAGFIGSHLVERFLNDEEYRQVKVTVIDNLSAGRKEYLPNNPERLRLVRCSIHDQEALAKITEKMSDLDAVIHLAAPVSVEESFKNPGKYYEQINDGTVLVLELARQKNAKKFILASTAAVYGDQRSLPVSESSPPSPQSPYAVEKLCAEQHAMRYARTHGLNTVILRFFNVYGARQRGDSAYAGVIPKFIDRLWSSQPMVIYDDGNQTRDMVYVSDVVEAILLTLDAEVAPGKILNIGTGKQSSVNDVANILMRLMSSDVQPKYEPAREGDIRHSVADCREAERAIGYRAQVSLEQGLRKTLGLPDEEVKETKDEQSDEIPDEEPPF